MNLFPVGSDANVVLQGTSLMLMKKRPLSPQKSAKKPLYLFAFNVLFAHLFAVLSRSQSMSDFVVNPCKHNTVNNIVTSVFSAIKSTDNKPTQAIPSKTIG